MPPSLIRTAIVVGLALVTTARGDDAPVTAKPMAYGEFVVIPLKVHVLSSKDLKDVDCGLTDDDIRRVVGKVNGIWHVAGVHFGLEPIVREPAAREDEFTAAMKQQPRDPLGSFKLLAPAESRSGFGMDVYYIHKFSVNGVFLGDRMAFVQETAKLRPVAGGIDEPLPRVTAHELGHALGLPHRQDVTNLLASGNNGTTLNDSEVARARGRALKAPGALTVEKLREKAEEALTKGETAEARRLWTWLAEVPGEEAEAAKKKLESIPPGK